MTTTYTFLIIAQLASLCLYQVVTNRIVAINEISNIAGLNIRRSRHLLPVWYTAGVNIVIVTICGIASSRGKYIQIGSTEISPFIVCAFSTFVTTIYMITKAARLKTTLRSNTAARVKRASSYLNRTQEPKFAFYFAHGDLNTPLHYLVWKKYMDALNEPYMVILRERKHLAFFMDKEWRTIPTILQVTGANLRNVLPKSVQTVFYANNGFKNVEMINASPKLRHVQLLHGDSDKPSSYNPSVRCYTDLFVSGQMGVDRYTNHGVYIDPDKTVVVGRPQVSDVTVVETAAKKSVITIGYMPTWYGYFEETQLSSLKIAGSMIKRILSHDFGDVKMNIIFKAHPLTYKDPASQEFLKEVRSATKLGTNNTLEILDETTDAISVFNKSDILISDISSVVIDFLYSKKPYLITNTNNFDLHDLDKYPCVRGGYLLTPEADNVIELLCDAMNEDTIKPKRMELRDYAFGDTHLPPGVLFRQKCLEIINR